VTTTTTTTTDRQTTTTLRTNKAATVTVKTQTTTIPHVVKRVAKASVVMSLTMLPNVPARALDQAKIPTASSRGWAAVVVDKMPSTAPAEVTEAAQTSSTTVLRAYNRKSATCAYLA